MFNWLNNTFQKHHKIMMGFLLVVMVASFVLYGFVGQDHGPQVKKSVYRGIDLSNAIETRDARNLAAYFSMYDRDRNGNPAVVSTGAYATVITNALLSADNGATDRNFAMVHRAIDLIKDADDAGIPAPDDKSMRKLIESDPLFQRDGKFSPESVSDVTTFARENAGLDEANLQSAMANLWRIKKLNAVLYPENAPALDVLASRRVMKNNAKWNVETAAYASDGFKLPAAPTDKAIADYFEKNKATYRVAEKIRVRAIKVTGEPEKTPATISDAELDATGRLHAAELGITTLDQLNIFIKTNRDRLVSLMVADRAGEKAALALSRKLNAVLPATAAKPDDAKLAEILKTAGITATPLPAFSGQQLPTGTGIPDSQLAAALRLAASNWRSDVSAVGATAYAFIFDGTIPARDATLAEVRAKVLADYTVEETRIRFDESARAKAAQIAAAVKAGKSFADAAKTAGFTPEPAVEFVYDQAPAKFDPRTLALLEARPVGAVSDIIRDLNGVFVAHVVSRVEQAPKQDAGALATERAKLGAEAASATYGSLRDNQK